MQFTAPKLGRAAHDALSRGISKGKLADPAERQMLVGIALNQQRRLGGGRGGFHPVPGSAPQRVVADRDLWLIGPEIAWPGSATPQGESPTR